MRTCRAIRTVAAAAAALLMAASLHAQPADVPELVTDRPDQTESAVVVPVGSVQVEAGWLLTRFEEGGDTLEIEEVPGTLVRIGLHERLELRLAWDGHVDEELETGGRRFGVSGAGDAAAGVKVAIAAEQGRRPESALLVHVGLPVGVSELTSDRFDPSWRLSFAHTLTERLSFGYNLGMAWASEETAPGTVETFSFGEYTAALGIGLADRLGAFVELFGEIPIDAPGGAAHSFDGGFTYLLRPNLQLDLASGVGLTDDAPDWFVGAGVSWRWPR